MNVNQVNIAGNLTRDPELRFTPKGQAVCGFGVAINSKRKGEDGAVIEEVTFVDVTAWGKTAEAIGQYLKKGRGIFVSGRLKTESWDDKNSGQKRTKLTVVCDSFQFVGGPDKQEGGPVQPPHTPRATRPAAPTDGGGQAEDQDRIPF